jgi:diguanylate cyclase (GGDEF)-like protein
MENGPMKHSDDSTDHGQRAGETDATMVGRAEEMVALAPGTKASLIVLEGWEIGREIEVHGHAQELGRSNLTSTLINAPSVSRRHAKIDLIDESGQPCFVLTDLGSSNGTRVNGERVERARLRTGDKVRLGDVLFKFVIQDAIDAKFHQKVHHLIHYDQLTGLLTMEAFRMRLDSLLRMRTKDVRFTLAMTDLDGLKKVNDTYGHLAGRMVVREMGVMIRQCLRSQDFAALYGGDETVLLFPDTALAEAAVVAEHLRETIAARVFEHNGHSFGVTISQGLAEWPQHGHGIEAIIASADAALYAAKAKGRNCVVCAEAAVG